MEQERDGYTFEISSADSGWNSGIIALKNKSLVTVPLHNRGSRFKSGGTVVASNVAKILTYCPRRNVRKNFWLLDKRRAIFVCDNQTRRLTAAVKTSDATIGCNVHVAALKISGTDFEFGTIVEGAEIICNYTIDDAGSIKLEVDIPAVGEEFYKNFYSREDAQIDFNRDASKLNRDGKALLDSVRELGRAIDDDGDDYGKLQRAGEVASTAISADRSSHDAEELKHIEEDITEVKKILADIRQRNRPNIRRDDLDGLNDYFESYAKNFAEPQEIAQIEKLLARAETLIERDDSAFEDTVDEIRGLCWKAIFFRDDEYAVYMFNDMIKHPEHSEDALLTANIIKG